MQGRLEISFERQGGLTRTCTLSHQAPLRVIRAFYPEGGNPAHVFLLNTTGGVLCGDELLLRLALGPGAQVLLTTPSAMRIHPARGRGASQKTVIRLGEGAVLEYLPEPTLPFAGSSFSQETEIFLADGAVLFYWDLLGPGRLGKGERFAYRSFQNRFRIYESEALLVEESFRLAPAERLLSDLGVMEEFTHLGSLYIVGVRDPEKLLSAFRGVDLPGVFWGASALAGRGVSVRALSRETPALQTLFGELWRSFRSEVLGRGLPPVRRY